MNHDYIKANEWSIIEEGFDPLRVKSSESLFSLGNGHMGQRANFEEQYSGSSFQGSYIAGVYYPDKTRVGWWKNGYPEYFAKVLNAPNWIGIDVFVDGEPLDLNQCSSVSNFRRELNMKEGWYGRSFEAKMKNGTEVAVKATRFLSLELDELGVINYEITAVNTNATVTLAPYIDSGIANEDSNWDDQFWETTSKEYHGADAFIEAKTLKTNFATCTYMRSKLLKNGEPLNLEPVTSEEDLRITQTYSHKVDAGDKLSVLKYGGYTVSRNHEVSELTKAASSVLSKAETLGYEALLEMQKKSWASIWEMADIEIIGDVKAQQGIRFNIFHLNQTYLGKDSRLNIGPKGFTGEKYGGSTYWDTEAYCIPFYMATKNQSVARNLLKYRYNHLQKAIENAEKLGFSGGAALYPMVTMNGEECHNEWEITFEEIHRNGAIAFAIYNYMRYTGDTSYLIEMGLEVLIGIARFWKQRASYSSEKEQYMILGVTGPNEYENNVNNNWYTNYLAKWCLQYTLDSLQWVHESSKEGYEKIISKTGFEEKEAGDWKKVLDMLYLPQSEKLNIFLQQDGFLDKELVPVSQLDSSERPINQHWSWDRILRSPYIKQADVLQGFYFFEDHFTQEELERHFDFYEPLTVHESSLSPCIHSILAAKLGRMKQAYAFYLRTSRLDLDDYNKEVEEGLHITSMAGTWMSMVEGFGGMRINEGKLSFTPQLPEGWEEYSFKINFRDHIITVKVNAENTELSLTGEQELQLLLNGKTVTLQPQATALFE